MEDNNLENKQPDKFLRTDLKKMLEFPDGTPADKIPKKEYTLEEWDKEVKEVEELQKKQQDNEKEIENNKNMNNKCAGIILDFIEKNNILLFHDQFNEGYAAINGDGTDIRKLNSKEFRQWILENYFNLTGNFTSEANLKMIITLLEYRAQREQQINLHVRVARNGMTIWYDLGNGKLIKINSDGWSIENKPPILFRHFKHQSPQITPEKGGSLNDFIKLINVKTDNDRILLKVYLVAAFIAGFPHPVLTTHGDQGAAKSTLYRMLKRIIDPSGVDLFEPPSSNYGIKEFIQTASHHWIIFLDNISFLSDELSDTLARICTGQGHSKRVLYSDDEDFLYKFQHIVGLNGINQVIRKPDLLNRSILLQMEKISNSNRLEEEELWKIFEEMKPKILGAIFNAVSSALHYYEQIKLNNKPRMADFAHWGCAIAKGLGDEENNFIKAYYENIEEQTEQALEASSIAQIIIKYVNENMQDTKIQTYTPTEWLNLLQPIAIELKADKDFPKNVIWLWRKIKPIVSDLLEKGIHIEKGKGTNRNIIIKKMDYTNEKAANENIDSKNDSNKILTSDFDF